MANTNSALENFRNNMANPNPYGGNSQRTTVTTSYPGAPPQQPRVPVRQPGPDTRPFGGPQTPFTRKDLGVSGQAVKLPPGVIERNGRLYNVRGVPLNQRTVERIGAQQDQAAKFRAQKQERAITAQKLGRSTLSSRQLKAVEDLGAKSPETTSEQYNAMLEKMTADQKVKDDALMAGVPAAREKVLESYGQKMESARGQHDVELQNRELRQQLNSPDPRVRWNAQQQLNQGAGQYSKDQTTRFEDLEANRNSLLRLHDPAANEERVRNEAAEAGLAALQKEGDDIRNDEYLKQNNPEEWKRRMVEFGMKIDRFGADDSNSVFNGLMMDLDGTLKPKPPSVYTAPPSVQEETPAEPHPGHGRHPSEGGPAPVASVPLSPAREGGRPGMLGDPVTAVGVREGGRPGVMESPVITPETVPVESPTQRGMDTMPPPVPSVPGYGRHPTDQGGADGSEERRFPRPPTSVGMGGAASAMGAAVSAAAIGGASGGGYAQKFFDSGVRARRGGFDAGVRGRQGSFDAKISTLEGRLKTDITDAKKDDIRDKIREATVAHKAAEQQKKSEFESREAEKLAAHNAKNPPDPNAVPPMTPQVVQEDIPENMLLPLPTTPMTSEVAQEGEPSVPTTPLTSEVAQEGTPSVPTDPTMSFGGETYGLDTNKKIASDFTKWLRTRKSTGDLHKEMMKNISDREKRMLARNAPPPAPGQPQPTEEQQQTRAMNKIAIQLGQAQIDETRVRIAGLQRDNSIDPHELKQVETQLKIAESLASILQAVGGSTNSLPDEQVTSMDGSLIDALRAANVVVNPPSGGNPKSKPKSKPKSGPGGWVTGRDSDLFGG